MWLPPNSSFWDDDRLRKGDELVLTLTQTDRVTAVMNEPLIAEYWAKRAPLRGLKQFVRVLPEGGGVYPVVYERDAVDNAESLSDIRTGRGERPD